MLAVNALVIHNEMHYSSNQRHICMNKYTKNEGFAKVLIILSFFIYLYSYAVGMLEYFSLRKILKLTARKKHNISNLVVI